MTEKTPDPDLKSFVQSIIEDWPDHGCLDSFDIYELAVDTGVLVGEERTEYCDENDDNERCSCREVDAGLPVTCYRVHWSILSGSTRFPLVTKQEQE